jgi:putative cell wall endopeptidase family protein
MKLILISFSLLFIILSPLKAQFYTIKPVVRPTFTIIKKETIPSISEDKESKDSLAVSELPEKNNLSGFSLPLSTPIVINSHYGYRTDPITGKQRFHHGIDIKSNASEVLSMLGGKVKKTGYEKKGLGNYVTMSYGDFELTYGHLSSIFVSPKDVVTPGTLLGISGSTGRSTGDHLHLSLKYKGDRTNPLPFVLFIKNRVLASLKQQNNITIKQ